MCISKFKFTSIVVIFYLLTWDMLIERILLKGPKYRRRCKIGVFRDWRTKIDVFRMGFKN